MTKPSFEPHTLAFSSVRPGHTSALGLLLTLGLLAAACSDDGDGTESDTGIAGSAGSTAAGAGGSGMAGSAGSSSGSGVEASPSGVAFPEGFRDWGLIGFSKRLDNGQVRAVVGNATAVQAAREGTTNPWPQGTILADVIRSQGDNPYFMDMEAGEAYAALAVMEKNSTRFADTGGWGYGVWGMGDSFSPGGIDGIVNPNDATDESTCFGCHNSRVSSRDFVFTRALSLPDAAEIGGAGESPEGQSLPSEVTGWRVINVHRRLDNGQMRVVLGNDVAVDHVRAGNTAPYAEGTLLADFVFAGQQGSPEWDDWVYANDFRAIAYMARDADFASTGGWGYSIWTNDMGTAELSSSGGGGTADDTTTCFGCHNTMVGAAEDYVFTQPAPVPDAP